MGSKRDKKSAEKRKKRLTAQHEANRAYKERYGTRIGADKRRTIPKGAFVEQNVPEFTDAEANLEE